MITDVTNPIDLKDTVVGYTLEASNGSSSKIFIPKLMSLMKRGTPKSMIAKTNGKKVFKNASDCKPKVSSGKLKRRNYLTATTIESIPKGDKIQCTFTNKLVKSIRFTS